MHRSSFLAFVLLVTLAACDSAEEERGPAFSATVSGNIFASFSGIPVADQDPFAVPSGETGVVYDLYFRGADSVYNAAITLTLVNSTIQAQSYTIVPTPGVIPPGNAWASFGIREASNRYRGFRNRGGTLTITRVSGNHVEGRFEFSASGDYTDQEVEVEGEFEAVLTERDE